MTDDGSAAGASYDDGFDEEPGRRGRRGWYVAGAALLVAIVAAAVVVGLPRRHYPRLGADKPLPSASSCVTPAVAGPARVPTPFLPTPVVPVPAGSATRPAGPPGGVVALATKAPGSGGIRVVTVAHTSFPYGGDSGRETSVLSIGAILENTSDQVAYGTRVSFHALDDGRFDPLATEIDALQQIPVLLPGERVGVGLEQLLSYTLDHKGNFGPMRITAVSVSLGSTRWLPQDGSYASIAAGRETVTPSGTHGIARAEYTMHSPYCRQLAAHDSGVLFYDTNGQLIGGHLQPVLAATGCRPGTTSVAEQTIAYLPPGIDPERIEVYPFCDPVPSPGLVFAGPGVPGNYVG